MSQSIAPGQWTYIGTVGTVLVSNVPAVALLRVIQWGTYVGSVVFHDAAATAGTSTTSAIGTLGLPTTSVPGAIDMNFRCRYGLVYQSLGTPNITIVWGDQ